MHPRAIADEVGLSVPEVRAALDELEAPDEESRSPDEGGRRIVRLDEHRAWGWRVVNYAKYRAIRDESDRREANRLAVARHREKKAKKSAGSAVIDGNQPSSMSPQSSHTEAEAEANTEAKGARADGSDAQAQPERDDAAGQAGPQQPPSAPAVTPTRAGRACLAMKSVGMQSVSPSNAKLLLLLAAGLTDEELADAAADAVARGKPFSYALATAEGRRRDAAATPAIPAAPKPAARDNGDFDRLKADQEALASRTPEQIEASRRVREAAMAAVRRTTAPKTTTQPKESPGS